MEELKKYISLIWKPKSSSFIFPLIENTYDIDDIMSMIEVILSDNLTMGTYVKQFEEDFAKFLNVEYAVMVNSGSSANLLAISALTNNLYKYLQPLDEILVPSVCWSTSVFPLIQCQLKPIFVDVDVSTLNIDLYDLENKINNKTKALMLVHVMGNCTDMDKLMNIVNKYNLILIEDTCESLGSMYDNKFLGTFGKFGTYSFYYSHHLTTIEGGMVVCKSKEDYDLLKCLRSHGWTRNLDNISLPINNIDPRYNFINLGYNLRPMELQAKMGISQLKKLLDKNNIRNINYYNIINKLKSYSNIFDIPISLKKSKPAWFGICIILKKPYQHLYKDYLTYLTENSIENRPIITGNITRQSVFKLYLIDQSPLDLPQSEIIHNRGFYIGLSCKIISEEKINYLINKLTSFFI